MRSARPWLLPALLLAVACGSKSGLSLLEPVHGAGGAGGAGAGGGAGGAAPMATCFSRGMPVAARPLGAACTFDGDTRYAIAVISGSRLYAIDGAGTLSTLFTFGTDWPFEPGSPYSEVVASRGGYLAAALAAVPKGAQSATVGVELVVIDPAGSVVFRLQRVVPYKNSVQLTLRGSETGIFAFGIESHPHRELVMVGAGGEQVGPLPDLLPFADPDAAGRIAVKRDDQRLWLEPCTGALTPALASTLPYYTAVHALGAELAYVDALTPTAALETADGATYLPLALPPQARLVLSHPSRWALFGTDVSPWTFNAANVPIEQVSAIEVALPAGLRRFLSGGLPGFDTSSTAELAFDSRGRIVVGLRDDFIGRLYASSDGSSWEPMGLPVGEVFSLQAIEQNGTYLISGRSMGQLPSDWKPAPPGSERIDGQQLQLVRPDAGLSLLLKHASPGTGFNRVYHVSVDGGCTATLLGGEKLEVTSAIDGSSSSFTFPESTYYGDFTFIPGSDASLRAY
jgi:hypothetical protein